MNKIRLWSLTLLAYLIVAAGVSAHVQLDNPVGGETFVAGDTITIEWQILISHQLQNWDLHYSPDGGATWEEIEIDLPPSQLTYDWIIPEITTEQAKVRIYMDNASTDYLDISGNFTIQGMQVSVRHQNSLPEIFTLSQNYPNPFNPETTIKYLTPVAGEVSIMVYNLLGEEVSTLVNSKIPAGEYRVTWDASDMASGVYLYRMKVLGRRSASPTFIRTRKMVLLK